jgi:hypothetical protein
MQIQCPTCGRRLEYSEAPLRPFCSERCRLIDLGGWLSERNVIAGEAVAADPDGLPGSEDDA